MQKVQKTYTIEFKREAVQLAQTSGKPIAQVARELGIGQIVHHRAGVVTVFVACGKGAS